MSRHSKNNTASSVFSYAERKMVKDYGVQKQRLNTENQKKFGVCQMFLHELQNPLCCDKGHVFCKDCAMEALVNQKIEKEKKLKLWEKQQHDEELEEFKKEKLDQQHQIEKFEKFQDSLDPKIIKENRIEAKYKEENINQNLLEKVQDITKAYEQKSKEEEIQISFWKTQALQEIKTERLKKPSQKLQCPATLDHNIKMKELYKVELYQIQGEGYCCHLCSKKLNFQKIGTLKTCGHVCCYKCIEVTASKNLRCGVCDKKCSKEDIIQLEESLSGFASHNSVEAQVYTPQIRI